MWCEDYVRNLPSLGKGKGKFDLKVGTIVLIRDEGKPRLKWPMGEVPELIHGKDGLVRAVYLKTEKCNLRRAVQNFHTLGVSGEENDNSEFQISNKIQAEDHVSVRSGKTIRPPKILDL